MSDLLDYISPSHDAKGRDVSAIKRKSYITKVCRCLGNNQSSIILDCGGTDVYLHNYFEHAKILVKLKLYTGERVSKLFVMVTMCGSLCQITL